MLTDWETLKPGQHIKLECSCEGFVVRVTLHNEPNREGFYFLFTSECDGISCKEAYEKGYGPFCNMFNYGMCNDAMPAIEVPIPSWWTSKMNEKLRQMIERESQEHGT